ncbi:MAG: hypothetical protein SWN10_24825, partial [Pseudomonadota bacterium]|nr:hypothetical protein [Pseudomonadota bacterium]
RTAKFPALAITRVSGLCSQPDAKAFAQYQPKLTRAWPLTPASMRGFVVKAKPQRKRRRRAWPCYAFVPGLAWVAAVYSLWKRASKALAPVPIVSEKYAKVKINANA